MKSCTIVIIVIIQVFIYGCMKKEKTSNTESNVPYNSKQEFGTKGEPEHKDTTKLEGIKTIPEKVDTFTYYADIKGIRYYFPCAPCRDRFIRDPEKYLEKKRKAGAKVSQREL